MAAFMIIMLINMPPMWISTDLLHYHLEESMVMLFEFILIGLLNMQAITSVVNE